MSLIIDAGLTDQLQYLQTLPMPYQTMQFIDHHLSANEGQESTNQLSITGEE